ASGDFLAVFALASNKSAVFDIVNFFLSLQALSL
ncbi:hypothetical protein LCGC14_1097030, partial [marine sediment metagenome]